MNSNQKDKRVCSWIWAHSSWNHEIDLTGSPLSYSRRPCNRKEIHKMYNCRCLCKMILNCTASILRDHQNGSFQPYSNGHSSDLWYNFPPLFTHLNLTPLFTLCCVDSGCKTQHSAGALPINRQKPQTPDTPLNDSVADIFVPLLASGPKLLLCFSTNSTNLNWLDTVGTIFENLLGFVPLIVPLIGSASTLLCRAVQPTTGAADRCPKPAEAPACPVFVQESVDLSFSGAQTLIKHLVPRVLKFLQDVCPMTSVVPYCNP